jgi:Uncharacterized conserved protein
MWLHLALEAHMMQVIIELEQWFAAEILSKKGFTLAGYAVTPAFKFDGFELGNKDELFNRFPQHAELIKRLCR